MGCIEMVCVGRLSWVFVLCLVLIELVFEVFMKCLCVFLVCFLLMMFWVDFILEVEVF